MTVQRGKNCQRAFSVLLILGAGMTAACGGTSEAPDAVFGERPDARDMESQAGLSDPERTGEFASAPPQGTLWRWAGWHEVPYDPEVGGTLRRARTLEREGSWEEALGALNQGLERDPDSWVLLEARGAIYARLEYGRAAQRDFERSVQLQPERAAAWCALGLVRQQLELPRSALGALEHARELGYETPELHLATARSLRKLGHRRESAARYAKALRDAGDMPPEILLEAASLCVHPDDVTPEAWEIARLRTNGSQETELTADGIAELRSILSRHGPTTVSRLRRAFNDSGLDQGELESWTRTALVAVTIDPDEVDMADFGARGGQSVAVHLGEGSAPDDRLED